MILDTANTPREIPENASKMRTGTVTTSNALLSQMLVLSFSSYGFGQLMTHSPPFVR
jgi:hypothetical protein